MAYPSSDTLATTNERMQSAQMMTCIIWATRYVPLLFSFFFTYELVFFFRFDDNDNTPLPYAAAVSFCSQVAMGPVPGPRQVPRHTAPLPRLPAYRSCMYDHECGQVRQQNLNLVKKLHARPGDRQHVQRVWVW